MKKNIVLALIIFLIVSCSSSKTTKVNIEVGVNDYATLNARKSNTANTKSKKVDGPQPHYHKAQPDVTVKLAKKIPKK